MTQEEALKILKTGANVFLTGEPGAGKSHTVNEYVSYARSHDLEVAITASTGIAATHIGGMTIHSWSGIGIASRFDRYLVDKIGANERVVKRINRAKVLIIDEVSMLAPETLSLVDAVVREVKRNSLPFGGLQVILVGDFFQLPPVRKLDEFNQPARLFETPKALFAYDAPAWERLNPVVCYLTEQHRQEDPSFLEMLTAIRSNAFSDGHTELVAERKIVYGAAPKDAPKLYSHNVDVDRVNSEMLATLPGETHVFDMVGQGAKPLVEALKKGCLSPESLKLKVGAAVMFTKNNPVDGYVNGTLGVVEGFSDSGMPVVRTRRGEIINATESEWSVNDNGKLLAQIQQIPLRLAWAITVHKSQGMSLDEAVMDLSKVFEYGQGYVALSRVRTLAGVHLLGWNEQAFMVHPEVLAKDQVFKEASEEAREVFGKLPKEELATMHGNFIKACGGTVTAKQPPEDSLQEIRGSRKAGSTVQETVRLYEEGNDVKQIAAIRKLSVRTIFGHLLEWYAAGGAFDVDKYVNAEDDALIRSALAKADSEHPLSSVKLQLPNRISYEQIRLVMVKAKKDTQ